MKKQLFALLCLSTLVMTPACGGKKKDKKKHEKTMTQPKKMNGYK